ncbi:hypothetical protein NLJ89_g3923 [Agrocybe chaxingu]|uniref:Carbonic anhydrase n=1 Tax=Agrocybe chaxingu TaxID=84603 RepID=A0A9W8KAE0_9AGAR|nr:hypothetical protein NLJ89_g3923 [Agrocybe chaxingu]
MLVVQLFSLFILTFTSLPVHGSPLTIPKAPIPGSASTTNGTGQALGAQKSLTGSPNSGTRPLRSLGQLYDGNKKYRESARVEAEVLADDSPSFMFFGCTDNRISPSTIFNAPKGSTISHNNIANQYSDSDPSADAAIAYAIESLRVQHIIVLGHYGCKGVEMAITRPPTVSDVIKDWLQPISDLYRRARRAEIVKLRDSRKPQRGKPDGVKEAPPANDPGFRALVEENVKHSVNELRGHSLLTETYAKNMMTDKPTSLDVFVHGFVFDEATGEVNDLHVSFGPPGKNIPNVPFKAVQAAKNFHRESYRPGIFKGKTWDFKAHSH